jgi:hypothetical protein
VKTVSAQYLQTLTNIVSIITGVFVIISVFFIWYQIKERNRLTRATITQSLVELSSPFLIQLSEDRKLAELWVNGSKNFEAMDEVDRFRYQQMLFWWLILHENIYYQHHNGLVDEKVYEGWNVELEQFIHAKQIGLFWDKDMKRFFRTEFRQAVGGMIRDA